MKDERLHVPNMILIGSTGKNSGKTYFGTKLVSVLAKSCHVEVLKIAIMRQGILQLMEEQHDDSGKDTALYLAAGAKRAVFMKSIKDDIMKGFETYLPTVPEGALIICESNSLAGMVRPGLFIMVKGPGEEVKSSAQNVMEYADLIFRNEPPEER